MNNGDLPAQAQPVAISIHGDVYANNAETSGFTKREEMAMRFCGRISLLPYQKRYLRQSIANSQSRESDNG